jgi:hypothetical protein
MQVRPGRIEAEPRLPLVQVFMLEHMSGVSYGFGGGVIVVPQGLIGMPASIQALNEACSAALGAGNGKGGMVPFCMRVTDSGPTFSVGTDFAIACRLA